jgi:thioesterase domain-containing protein
MTMNAADLLAIEHFLHAHIPLAGAMGVKVESYLDGKLVLTAPLRANHNHLGTAFGGSLATLATLAGYALLWIELGDQDAHIVIGNSEIHYRSPVRGDLRASCERPDSVTLARFKAQFARKEKARLTLDVTIDGDGGTGMEFRGTYVALR